MGQTQSAQASPAPKVSKEADKKPAAPPSTKPARKTNESTLTSPGDKQKLVMGRYRMGMSKEDVLGQGSSSICRKGIDTTDGSEVAIKLYKSGKHSGTTLKKFVRQIEVLRSLLEPFEKPSDERYWHPRLNNTMPKHVFMELLDYSKTASGEPGPDATDQQLYVITEVAQYSMKEYFALRREQSKPLSSNSVHNIADAILLVMAGLHAKGLVHIDFKPENMMMFNGHLKLIDVDGCVKSGSKVAITDSSISFSPCYCAPEWAKFLIDESNSTIIASPMLDVWSVGMTLCELVTLDAVLKPMYASFLRNNNRNQQEAGFLFMEWLSSVKKAPVPKSIAKFDASFGDLVSDWLCKPDIAQRKTCAEALNHSYVAPHLGVKSEQMAHRYGMEGGAAGIRRERRDDEEAGKALYVSTLFKLNRDAKPDDKSEQWLQRDMWISPNGNLCYKSQKEQKCKVLLDAHAMHGSKIEKAPNAARDFAFVIKAHDDACPEVEIETYLAADSEKHTQEWLRVLGEVAQSEHAHGKTFRLGEDFAEARKEFKMRVNNRRQKVDQSDGFEAVTTSKLWKVRGEGDPMADKDWFLREFCVVRNGSLTYKSEREQKELVYYTADDVSKATVRKLEAGSACKANAFSITLAPDQVTKIEYEPGIFAAESEEGLKQWFEQFALHGSKVE